MLKNIEVSDTAIILNTQELSIDLLKIIYILRLLRGRCEDLGESRKQVPDGWDPDAKRLRGAATRIHLRRDTKKPSTTRAKG